jgi:hypothetical protein
MEEDSKTYRERAMHARLGAKEATTTQHRLIFERLAESYDKLAHDTEWLEGTAARMNAPQNEPRERGENARSRRAGFGKP